MKKSVIKLILFLIICLLANISCFHKKDGQTLRKKEGNDIIEANFINDTIIDGVAKYYRNENLISVVTYRYDSKFGPAINFYDNGKKKDSMNYINGLLNGNVFHYNIDGKVDRVVSYYYGLLAGDNSLYSSGRPVEYSYRDFNSNILFACSYDSLGRCKVGKFGIKAIINTILDDDDAPAAKVFLYLVKPPNLNTTYQIGLINDKNEIKKQSLLRNDRLFLDTILYRPESGWNYCISTHFENQADSINKLFIERLEW